MASRTFGSKQPYKPHLNRGSGGVQAEISRLRLEIDQAFSNLETGGQLARFNVTTTSPTVNDDEGEGYAVFSRWINALEGLEFVCVDASEGAAIWVVTGGAANPRRLQRRPSQRRWQPALPSTCQGPPPASSGSMTPSVFRQRQAPRQRSRSTSTTRSRQPSTRSRALPRRLLAW